MLIGVNQAFVLGEITILNIHFNKLTWEIIGIIIFLKDAEFNVLAISSEVWRSSELRIYDWVKLQIVVIWVNADDFTVLSFELEHKQEAAALLVDVFTFEQTKMAKEQDATKRSLHDAERRQSYEDSWRYDVKVMHFQ